MLWLPRPGGSAAGSPAVENELSDLLALWRCFLMERPTVLLPLSPGGWEGRRTGSLLPPLQGLLTACPCLSISSGLFCLCRQGSRGSTEPPKPGGPSGLPVAALIPQHCLWATGCRPYGHGWPLLEPGPGPTGPARHSSALLELSRPLRADFKESL